MSFLSTSSTSSNVNSPSSRCEEMRTLFNSLNHDIILRQHTFDPPSPPLTPKSPLHSISTNHLTSFKNSSMEPAFIPRFVRSPQHMMTTSQCSSNNVGQSNRFAHAQYTSTMHHRDGFCKCCTTTRNEMPTDPSHHDVYRRQYIHMPSPSYSHKHNIESTRLASEYAQFQSSLTATSLSPSSPLKRKHWVETTRDKYHQQPSLKQPKMSNEDDRRRSPPPTIDDNMEGKGNDKNACQIHGLLSLPGSREPRYVIIIHFFD